ncbi:hypothetical protein AcV5_008458 [Taiwanofungus camphoratus]|nr:hypothetical protein AcV5_008458 [Antrodia cinnamomea]
MSPLFSNPNLLSLSLQPTSRAALNVAEIGPRLETESSAHRAGMIAELNKMLMQSIDGLTPNAYDRERGQGEETRKNKRRRIEIKTTASGESPPPESLPFRLVSQSLPPKTIILQSKQVPDVIIKEPPCEDDDAEAERRALQAQAVAVDFEWILEESKRAYCPWRADNKVLHVKADLPAQEPAIMVVERLRPIRKPPKLSLSAPASAVRPSPHNLAPSVINYPIVDMTAEAPADVPESRRKRRRKRRTIRPRPTATFWRPLREWGIKAAGYAMGYEGSWPVLKDDPLRHTYQRDTMRKGFFA